MIEVAEDHRHALALFTERVRQWNADLVERHKRRARGSRIRSLDRLGGDVVRAGDENDSVSAICLAANSEVVRERAIRYPSVRSRINIE